MPRPPHSHVPSNGDASVGELFGSLVHETHDLISLEAARLRAEMIEHVSRGTAQAVSAVVLGAIVFVLLQLLAVVGVLSLGALLGSYAAGAAVSLGGMAILGGAIVVGTRRLVNDRLERRLESLPGPDPEELSRPAPALQPRQGANH